jgi:hypothetical protein
MDQPVYHISVAEFSLAFGVTRMLRLVPGVFLILICGCNTIGTFGGSGIEGTVLAGPQCPAHTSPPTPGCEDQPWSATIVVRSQSGLLEVTRFTSDSNGTFNVELPPGTYRLEPQPGSGGYPFAAPQVVTVQPLQFTQVTIHYDTGIR